LFRSSLRHYTTPRASESPGLQPRLHSHIASLALTCFDLFFNMDFWSSHIPCLSSGKETDGPQFRCDPEYRPAGSYSRIEIKIQVRHANAITPRSRCLMETCAPPSGTSCAKRGRNIVFCQSPCSRSRSREPLVRFFDSGGATKDTCRMMSRSVTAQCCGCGVSETRICMSMRSAHSCARVRGRFTHLGLQANATHSLG
jgi:hypothetical protein